MNWGQKKDPKKENTLPLLFDLDGLLLEEQKVLECLKAKKGPVMIDELRKDRKEEDRF